MPINLRVWHPESPGTKVFVRRNWLQDLVFPHIFASISEKLLETEPARYEDRTRTLWKDQERWAREARMRNDAADAEQLLRDLQTKKFYGSHLPEQTPD